MVDCVTSAAQIVVKMRSKQARNKVKGKWVESRVQEAVMGEQRGKTISRIIKMQVCSFDLVTGTKMQN